MLFNPIVGIVVAVSLAFVSFGTSITVDQVEAATGDSNQKTIIGSQHDVDSHGVTHALASSTDTSNDPITSEMGAGSFKIDKAFESWEEAQPKAQIMPWELMIAALAMMGTAISIIVVLKRTRR